MGDQEKPARPSGNETFLTDEQFAARWAVSPKTLRNARVAGRLIGFVKIGRSVRYRLSDLALERHEEILSQPITEETDLRNKRLVAEVATATVKAAISTDKTALKACRDNILERVFLRILVHQKLLGEALGPQEMDRLRRASRAEIEAALDPRTLAEFDAAAGLASLGPTSENLEDRE